VRLGQNVVDLLRNPESPDGLVRDALLDLGWDVANVYVVFGASGSYSDRDEWYVAAFLDEGQAKTFRDRLNEWARSVGVHDETTYQKAEALSEEAGFGDETWEYRKHVWKSSPDQVVGKDGGPVGGCAGYSVFAVQLRVT
jgi:hypothetical protein